MTKDLMTAHERKRAILHAKVCEMYRNMVADPANAGVSPTRLMRAIGHKMGLTTKGVNGILTRYGVYTPVKR